MKFHIMKKRMVHIACDPFQFRKPCQKGNNHFRSGQLERQRLPALLLCILSGCVPYSMSSQVSAPQIMADMVIKRMYSSKWTLVRSTRRSRKHEKKRNRAFHGVFEASLVKKSMMIIQNLDAFVLGSLVIDR